MAAVFYLDGKPLALKRDRVVTKKGGKEVVHMTRTAFLRPDLKPTVTLCSRDEDYGKPGAGWSIRVSSGIRVSSTERTICPECLDIEKQWLRFIATGG